MSFIITVYVNDGIVMASDRRLTYQRNIEKDGKQVTFLGSNITNNTDKTFLCPNNAGISWCGDGSLNGKPITGYINDMIRNKVKKNTSVSDMPDIVIDYFSGFNPVPNTTFLIGGYENAESGTEQKVFSVNPKSQVKIPIDTSGQGASWDGETMTLTRLIKPVALKDENGNYNELPNEGILWEQMTLQDAVDFARYAVGVTIDTMKFKNVIETVGGSIDVLVITPDKAEWLQKEELH